MNITIGYKGNMKEKTPFGMALRYYRKNKKPPMNQKKLAKKLGLTQAMISKMETGTKGGDGSFETREKIIKYFGVDYSEFIKKGEELLGTTTKKNITPISKNNSSSEIIKQFQDPKKAKTLNEMLIKIESVDPQGYDLIYNDVKKMHDIIERITSTSPPKETGTGPNG